MPEYSCDSSYNETDWLNHGNHSTFNATETSDVCDLGCNIEFDNSTMQNTIGTDCMTIVYESYSMINQIPITLPNQ